MTELFSDPFQSIAREPSLSDKVAEQLTEAIISRQLRAGDRLPSERELGDRFKVSRTVVREAVRSLAARGLVRVTSGRGVEINQFGSEGVTASLRLLVRGHQGLDYAKVHEVRAGVEVQVAGLAAERAQPAQLALLEQLCEEHQRGLEENDLAAASEADYQFHRELTRAAGNELLLAMLDSIAEVLREIRYQLAGEPFVSAEGLKAHRRILRAVASRKPSAAREAMAEHLAESERVWRAVKSGSAPAPSPKGASASKKKTARSKKKS